MFSREKRKRRKSDRNDDGSDVDLPDVNAGTDHAFWPAWLANLFGGGGSDKSELTDDDKGTPCDPNHSSGGHGHSASEGSHQDGGSHHSCSSHHSCNSSH